MKRTLLGILTFVYITVASGVVVNMHYCMGKLAGVGYGYEETNQCSKCGMHDNGCCHNDPKFIKITDDQQIVKTGVSFAPFSVEAVPVISSVAQPIQGTETVTCLPHHSPPDKHWPAVYLINCVFRI
ncbi:MAG: hypothetical protein JST47_15720 [Bacteroidetes bacterium]|nr:hypothetical protein [Bacteroidota bacterium]MBS1974365.1 hypothetical protein [Bacteroidota bacterium]